jgi:hypothetical protein
MIVQMVKYAMVMENVEIHAMIRQIAQMDMYV